MTRDRPPAKRPRTSGDASRSSSASSVTLRSPSPAAPSATDSHEHSGRNRGDSRAIGKSRAERLAGFDDEADEPTSGELAPSPRTTQLDDDEDSDEDPCAICLAPIENKTVVYPCHHGQFCWNCIRAWTDQSRKCPLCLGPIAHLIHNIRSVKDYSTYHLLPLHTLPAPSSASSTSAIPPASRRGPTPTSLPRHALYGKPPSLDTPTPRERLEEIALERRKYIYREGLYAKHVASNRYTGFKPFGPNIFSNNPDLKARVIGFIRRELQVFPAVDVAFLTTYLISIASQLDLRSPSALRLISDFLSDTDAEHLVHEITSYARSPFKSLEAYDRFIQYGRPEQRIEPNQASNGFEHGADRPRFADHMHPPPGSDRDTRRDRYSTKSRSRREHNMDTRSFREPDWRDRDQHYVGKYRRDSRQRTNERRGHTSERDARYSRSPERERSDDIVRGGSRRHSNSGKRSCPAHSERDARRQRSPSPRHHRERSPSQSRFSPRRSRSPTPALHESPTRTARTPSPPRLHALDPEYEDAISLNAPALSSERNSIRTSQPLEVAHAKTSDSDDVQSKKPSISIFGAARRLLGNGDVVTFSSEGKVQLQRRNRTDPEDDTTRGDLQEDVSRQKKDSRIMEQERYQPVPKATASLAKNRSPSPVQAQLASTSPSNRTTAASNLRAKLQERLNAEYRQALLQLNASSSTNEKSSLPGGSETPVHEGKRATVDRGKLRSLLQSRLQAEKALAYDTQKSRYNLEPPTQSRVYESIEDLRGGPTTFSQSTKELLLMRLEEEKLLALEQGTLVGVDTIYSDKYTGRQETESSSLASQISPAASPTSNILPTANQAELDLKAKLLEKRKAVVEEELRKRSGELKEKLMREKLKKKRLAIGTQAKAA
ncbi:uncharacterized protein JCM15063_005251 [Sporobolomyces koalae]|uniref:uncharacterized protein n=1 Tax=Sporobolomyces koalae TaxID=500713 RepID=UPI003176CB95